MKQVELNKGRLLDKQGNLSESGYSTSLVKEYDRKDIKARSLRIKEWDYYYIGNNDYGIALTIADNSYMGLMSVSVLDFKTKEQHTESVMTLLPKGKTNMPSTSETGDVFFKNKRIEISFTHEDKSRRLYCNYLKYNKVDDFICDIILYDEPNNSMVIATPFIKKRHFYYNQKINCFKAIGKATLGDKEYVFDDKSFAVLDWGRGVWTYKNTWYWSSLNNCLPDGTKIGFNLGYGFGCNENASENMIFYDNDFEKVDEVEFIIPKKGNKFDYMGKWKFISNDQKVNLTFEPILDRFANSSALVIKSLQHQVFGKFSGTLVYKGKQIEIKELVGFAERVENKW